MAFGRRKRREQINDDQELAQYGSSTRPKEGPAFRSQPRADRDKGGLSMIRGRVAAAKAHMIVGMQAPRPGDGVRHTTAGMLRQAGFIVEHDPTQVNPDHVRVTVRGDWSIERAKRFEGCFTEEPDWMGREGSQ